MVIRLSWSILNCWSRGDYEQAIQMYLRKPMEPTPAMIEGQKMHQKWEQEVIKNRRLPAVFGGNALFEPLVEKQAKREIMLNDWLQLVGVPDVIDGIVGRDWKYGSTPSTAYASGLQHKVLQILFPYLKRFEYHCYNPYVSKDEAVTVSIVHLTDRTLEQGIEWVLAHGSNFRAYLEANNISGKE